MFPSTTCPSQIIPKLVTMPYCKQILETHNLIKFTQSTKICVFFLRAGIFVLFIDVTKCLEWYLAHSRHSIKICQINELNDSL